MRGAMSVQCESGRGKLAAGPKVTHLLVAVGTGVYYLCPENIRGPGPITIHPGVARERQPSPTAVAKEAEGASLPGESQLPEPHSLYGALLFPASPDCRSRPAPLPCLPLPFLLGEVLELPTRCPQWPGGFQGPAPCSGL